MRSESPSVTGDLRQRHRSRTGSHVQYGSISALNARSLSPQPRFAWHPYFRPRAFTEFALKLNSLPSERKLLAQDGQPIQDHLKEPLYLPS